MDTHRHIHTLQLLTLPVSAYYSNTMASSPSSVLDLSGAAEPVSFLPATLPATSNLSIALSSPSSNTPTSIHPPSFHSPSSPLIPRPRSSSIDLHGHLPPHHQVLTPTSRPLILTAPPTPSSSPSIPSPSSIPTTEALALLVPEERFVPIHIKASSPTLQADLYTLLSRLYYPFLSRPLPHLPPSADSLVVTPITGGITNSLYRVSLQPPFPPTPILVRIFGLSTDQVIDRLTEQVITVALSKNGFGVRLHGHFDTGRLEEWLEAQPLTWEEMADMGEHLGREVGSLHRQALGDIVPSTTSPLYSTLQEWMKGALTVRFDDPTPAAAKKAALLAEVDVAFWQKELQETLQLLSASAYADEPLVFCHNDLLSGNVLRQKRGPGVGVVGGGKEGDVRLYLVDFEYSAFNFAAFDIANHWLECCGFDCQWDHFPSAEQRRRFLRFYLSSVKGKKGGVEEVQEEEVSAWEEKVTAFLVLSHLWWGIWAILQAKYSTIDFDYLSYSLLRKDGYLRMKDDSWRLLRKHPRKPHSVQ